MLYTEFLPTRYLRFPHESWVLAAPNRHGHLDQCRRITRRISVTSWRFFTGQLHKCQRHEHRASGRNFTDFTVMPSFIFQARETLSISVSSWRFCSMWNSQKCYIQSGNNHCIIIKKSNSEAVTFLCALLHFFTIGFKYTDGKENQLLLHQQIFPQLKQILSDVANFSKTGFIIYVQQLAKANLVVVCKESNHQRSPRF